MNIKRYLLAVLVVLLVYEGLNFVIHGVLLMATYEALHDIWRPEMNSIMWIMNIGTLIFSLAFVYIFAKGYEGKGILEGIRFSVIIAVLMLIPGMLSQYVVYPVPFSLAIKWMLYGLVQYVACGIVTALIYKPKTA